MKGEPASGSNVKDPVTTYRAFLWLNWITERVEYQRNLRAIEIGFVAALRQLSTRLIEGIRLKVLSIRLGD